MNTHQSAFTVLELLTVIVLLSIASTIMLPAMGRLLDQAQVDSQKNTLISHIQAARAHAVEHAVLTELCGSSDGQHCDGDWPSGWLVRERTNALPLLQHSVNAVALKWSGFSPEIVFHPNGSAPSSNGRFSICSGGRTTEWALILNRQGRLRAERSGPTPQNIGC